MATAHRPAKSPIAKAVFWLVPVTFLAAVFLAVFGYVLWRVSPAFEYHVSGPFLLLEPSLFKSGLKPAGLLELAGALLAQLNYQNWSGALAFTLMAVVAWLLTRIVLQQITKRSAGVAALVPVFLLLALRNQHGHTTATVGLGLLGALTAATACFRWLPHAKWLRPTAWLLVSAALLLTGGFGPALTFSALVLLFEGLQKKRWTLKLAALAGAATATLALHLSGMGPGLNSRLDTPLLLAIAVYLCVPTLALSLRMLTRTAAPEPQPNPTGKHERKRIEHAVPMHHRPILGQALAGGLLLAGAALVWFTFDAQRKAAAEIDYHFDHGNFDRVLQVAAKQTGLDLPAQIRMHRALFHQGQLAENLFTYPNQLGIQPLPGVAGGIISCRAQTRALLEMGLVSDAEHLAHEALEMERERPDVLVDLAEINVLKDRPVAAGMFANVLRKVPFQAAAARQLLAGLDDACPSKSTRLDGIRPLMVTNDLPHEGLPTEALLIHYLQFNPTNRMAFEYLMTHYLLTLDLRKLVDRLWQLNNFSYPHVPRHYEEALLLYQNLSGARIELSRPVRPETAQRFAAFSEAMRQKLYSTPAGQAQLAREFGDTYWYYYYATQSYLKSRRNNGAD